jgi:hypothetical protein
VEKRKNCQNHGFSSKSTSYGMITTDNSFSSIVFARQSYTVTIVCPQGSGMAGNRMHFISADSDLDAMNQANKILIEHSIYKNKGCVVKEVRKD